MRQPRPPATARSRFLAQKGSNTRLLDQPEALRWGAPQHRDRVVAELVPPRHGRSPPKYDGTLTRECDRRARGKDEASGQILDPG